MSNLNAELNGCPYYSNQSMTEGILTKLSFPPSYQNLGQRARPCSVCGGVTEFRDGYCPTAQQAQQTHQTEKANQFKVKVNQKDAYITRGIFEDVLSLFCVFSKVWNGVSWSGSGQNGPI